MMQSSISANVATILNKCISFSIAKAIPINMWYKAAQCRVSPK